MTRSHTSAGRTKTLPSPMRPVRATSTILRTTTLSAADIGVRYADGPNVVPAHDAAYWDHATRGFDFSDADRVPADIFNEVLWEGLKPGVPYPTVREGRKPAGAHDISSQ